MASEGRRIQLKVPTHGVCSTSVSVGPPEVRQPEGAGGGLCEYPCPPPIPVQLLLGCGEGGLGPDRLTGWRCALTRHLYHHTSVSQGPPPAGFNYQSLRRAPGSFSQAVPLHPRPGRAGSRAAGAGLKPLPLEFPSRLAEPPVEAARRAEPGSPAGIIPSNAAAAAPRHINYYLPLRLTAVTGGAGAAVRWGAGGSLGRGCGAVRGRSGGGKGSSLRSPDPGSRALRRSSANAGAAPHPRRPHPDENPCGFQHHPRQACSLDTLAGVFLCVPSPVPRHTQTQRPIPLLPSQMPKLLRAGAARRPAGPGWPGAPSLTLSRQLTFSVGYTTFPQRAHWGFIVAVPRGGGCAAAAGGSEEPL